MFSNPLKNLKALPLRENDVVVDLGAGMGFYSLLAGHLAPLGKVYAVEINKDYLATIKQKAKDARLSNVEILWANMEKAGGTKLKDNTAHVAIISNVMAHIENPQEFIKEVKRILKEKGRVLLVDWVHAAPLAYKKTLKKEEAMKLFEGGGFKLERELDAGEHNYGMILLKP